MLGLLGSGDLGYNEIRAFLPVFLERCLTQHQAIQDVINVRSRIVNGVLFAEFEVVLVTDEIIQLGNDWTVS